MWCLQLCASSCGVAVITKWGWKTVEIAAESTHSFTWDTFIQHMDAKWIVHHKKCAYPICYFKVDFICRNVMLNFYKCSEMLLITWFWFLLANSSERLFFKLETQYLVDKCSHIWQKWIFFKEVVTLMPFMWHRKLSIVWLLEWCQCVNLCEYSTPLQFALVMFIKISTNSKTMMHKFKLDVINK
jgi:hypothetical protein